MYTQTSDWMVRSESWPFTLMLPRMTTSSVDDSVRRLSLARVVMVPVTIRP